MFKADFSSVPLRSNLQGLLTMFYHLVKRSKEIQKKSYIYTLTISPLE